VAFKSQKVWSLASVVVQCSAIHTMVPSYHRKAVSELDWSANVIKLL